MKMKKRTRICLLIFSFLVGIALTIYPAVSNWLYEIRQDGVVETYQTTLDDNVDDDTKEAALSAARQYNNQLCAQSLNIDTQYHAAQELSLDSAVLSNMDVAGTGVIAYVEIPVIDTYLPIYYGTTADDLMTGVGVLEYSSLPVGGKGTHSILCGHSGMSNARIFSDLPEMVEGDVFFLHVLDETLAYQVEQITTVLPEDVSQIGIDPEMDYCTLLTCTPFGVNTHRLLVRGVRIDYQEAVEAAENLPDRPVQTDNTWASEYYQALAQGVIVLVIVLIVLGIVTVLRSLIGKKRSQEVNQK